MNEYFHKYKGIVIQNDDPDGMGRVKVFVPEISMTLFKDWNSDKQKDKKFTELGANLGSSITPEILERLKIALPWANVKMPIFGMGSSTTYHNDINFGEISNDEDNSKQHDKINKQIAASAPENNAFGGALANAIKTSDVAIASVDSASIINNYQNPSTTNASDNYLNNVEPTETTDEKILNPSLLTTSNLPNTDSNINKIIINFDPNARGTQANNIPRMFSTDATISQVGETPFTGQSSAAGIATSTVKVFTGTTTPVYSPPITYVHSPVTPPTKPLNTTSSITPEASPTFTDTLSSSATGVSTATTIDDKTISISFVPNARGIQPRNIPRVFTTIANITVYDGESISFPNPQDPSINTKVFRDDITSIVIGYDNAHKPINLQAADLGGLGDLLSEYSGTGSTGLVDNPISPPSSISSVFNRGGGGAELFALCFSTLLPLTTLLNCLVGNTNPSSKQTINQKKKEKINNGSDPHQTVGVNQQTSADCKPAMRSPTQNNKAKGMISIPAVGAKVAVYFDNGNPLYPIVDGVFYTQEDYAGLHDSVS